MGFIACIAKRDKSKFGVYICCKKFCPAEKVLISSFNIPLIAMVTQNRGENNMDSDQPDFRIWLILIHTVLKMGSFIFGFSMTCVI